MPLLQIKCLRYGWECIAPCSMLMPDRAAPCVYTQQTLQSMSDIFIQMMCSEQAAPKHVSMLPPGKPHAESAMLWLIRHCAASGLPVRTPEVKTRVVSF